MKFIFTSLIILSFVLGWFLRGNQTNTLAHELSKSSGLEGISNASDLLRETTTAAYSDDEIAELSDHERLERLQELSRSNSLKSTIRSLQLIESMDIAGLHQAMEAIEFSHDIGPKDYILQLEIMKAWVAIDPKSAHGYYQAITDPFRKIEYGNLLFIQWGISDPQAAFTAVEAIKNLDDRMGTKNSLMHGLSMRAPQQAFEILRSNPTSQDDWAYMSVFNNWAQQAPGTAIERLESMPPGSEREHALQGISIALIQQDLAQSAKLTDHFKDSSDRTEALSIVLNQWIIRDTDAALNYLEQRPENESKADLIANTVHSIATVSPQQALIYSQAYLEGEQFDDAIESIIYAVSQEAPERAISMIDELPFGRAYTASVNTIAETWATSDPIAAFEWASALPTGDERTSAMQHAIDTLVANDTEAAELRMRNLAIGPERALLISTISSQMAYQNPESALDWIHALEGTDAIQYAQQDVLEIWAATEPASLANYLSTQPVEKQNQHATDIARTWAREDPVAAANWAEQLQSDQARKDAIHQISWEWLEHNTYEATLWIAELDDSPARDQAVTNLVRKVTTSEPAAAFTWSATIADTERRQKEMLRVINRWKQDDAAAAYTAVEKSDLSDAEKQSLIID